MNCLSMTSGLFLIVGYFAVMMLLVKFIKGGAFSKASYLVADRNIGGVMAAFSIAATWVWAPLPARFRRCVLVRCPECAYAHLVWFLRHMDEEQETRRLDVLGLHTREVQ